MFRTFAVAMLFNSLQFLWFFPAVCVAYFALPRLWMRNALLLASSYYFYMCWQPIYALLLLTSTLVTYMAALGIERFEGEGRKRACLVGSLVLNLGILFFYKYYGFAAENLRALLAAAGMQMSVPEFKVLLPVGISFYTFQALGYSIDVYRGDTAAERNFARYALFVSFFPQLVAGPIERSTNLLEQFREKHPLNADDAWQGLKLMLWGYFLKMVVAERMAMIVNYVYQNLDNCGGPIVGGAAMAFYFQVYGDFAGYTFIAIGAARVMGFRLRDNFRRPHFALSVADYWRRWHISLTTWLTDYVFMPLNVAWRNLGLHGIALATLVTFAVSGLWHGAAWNFVAWGAAYGVLLAAETYLTKPRKRWEKRHKLSQSRTYAVACRVLTFLLICAVQVLFRARTVGEAACIYRNMAEPAHGTGVYAACGAVAVFALPALALVLVKEACEEFWPQALPRKHVVVWEAVWMAALAALVLSCGVFNGSQFIYFQF